MSAKRFPCPWDLLHQKDPPSPHIARLPYYTQPERTTRGVLIHSHHASLAFRRHFKGLSKSHLVSQNGPSRKEVRRPCHPTSPAQPPLLSFPADCRPYTDQMTFPSKMILMEPFRVCAISSTFLSWKFTTRHIGLDFTSVLSSPMSQLL